MPTWTMEERSRLLLTIIELLAPQKSAVKMPPWPQVADKMGSGFSGEAVRQQYQKLRKEGLPHNRKTLKRAKKNQTSIKQDLMDDDEYYSSEDEALFRKKVKRERASKEKKEEGTPPPPYADMVGELEDVKLEIPAASAGGEGPVLKMEGRRLEEGGEEYYEK